jgi:hypothetical protein
MGGSPFEPRLCCWLYRDIFMVLSLSELMVVEYEVGPDCLLVPHLFLDICFKHKDE